MSVAFRRESDEEHKEPRFELPLPPGPNLVTSDGMTLIHRREEALQASLAGADEQAAEAIRRELRYWATRRATAILTEPPRDGSVGFGSTVDFLQAGQRRQVAIVGDDEADPKAGRIAFSAPLARALIGSEPGDLVPFNGRDDALEILATVPAADPDLR